jgi:competence transcription factor ComK
MYTGLYLKYPLFLSDFNQTWIFPTFSKNTQISNFTKIRPVGAELFYADGQKHMMKLTVAFRNFANAPNKNIYYWCTSPSKQ